MFEQQKLTILYDANTIDLESWKLEQIGQAARNLTCPSQKFPVMIHSKDSQGNRFEITLAYMPTEPLLIYDATITDESTAPNIVCCRCNYTDSSEMEQIKKRTGLRKILYDIFQVWLYKI